MGKNKITFLLVVGSLISSVSFAAGDPESDAAVAEVQDMMKQPDFAANASKDSKEAAQMSAHVKNLTGSKENEKEFYALASEIFGNMKGMSPDEMKAFLQQASKNPEQFMRSLTPEQKKKLSELSQRLPAANAKRP